jgi:transcriptional antiterminator NusG
MLSRDSLCDILDNFAQVVTEPDRDGRKRRRLVFPRYHQLTAVRRLLTHARAHGVGQRYLVQHSAGSGKSNTIAWLTHPLIGLQHQGATLFDSVIVVTDRTVLDRQLRDSVRRFAHASSIVGEARSAGDLARFLRDGKKVSKERNYFPGYVLMEADLTGEIAHMLKQLPNVIGFLGAEKGGDPVPLRISEVNRILGKVDELAETEEAIHNPYHVGEGVKVIDGPFNGFNGVIEEINEEKKKLKVMVKIFGRKTPLELSFMQVEKDQ